jgi:hypothetical protein
VGSTGHLIKKAGGKNLKEIIICLSCKKHAESWDWVHDEEFGAKYSICMNCIKNNLKIPGEK